MRNNKRWIAVTALAAVTAAALATAVIVKNNLNKGPENAIELTQEGTDLGIKQVEALTDDKGNVIGYKVNMDAKGFSETPMELAISFNATVDTVTSVEVISQSETDNLGSNVTKSEFLDQFNGAKLPVYIEGMNVSFNDVIETFSLTSFEAATASAPVLTDGTYEVVADEFHNGYKSMVTLTVEANKITSVVWDCVDENGNYKSVLSTNGEYVMTEDGATWAEQAQALAANVIENQGVSALTMDEKGKTDAVATVSISIGDFVAQVEEAMTMASKAPTAATLKDGTYEVVADEFNNGYKSMVTLTVEGNKITSVVWDNIDENGNFKSVLSTNGEYVMTADGATWAEQAQALAANVIENQGVSALTMDEKGKTDAVATVSISIGDFVAQVEEAMAMASGEVVESVYTDGTYEIVADEFHNGYKSMVTLTVSGGKITSVVWDCVDENGNYKSVLSTNGEYVMTEDGATWAEQAQALAANVIENQGVSALTMDEKGKTDAVASVSISIGDFVSQVEEALMVASGQDADEKEEQAEEVEETLETMDGTKIDAISGATVTTKAVITAINNAYEYLVNHVVK